MNPRKATHAQRLRHSMLAQWRGAADGPLIDLPARALGDILAKVVKDLGLEERAVLDDVLTAWRGAVGDFIAKHTMPDSVTRGVLTVKVSQPSAHHSLMMEKPFILKKLNDRLTRHKIKDLRFRNG